VNLRTMNRASGAFDGVQLCEKEKEDLGLGTGGNEALL